MKAFDIVKRSILQVSLLLYYPNIWHCSHSALSSDKTNKLEALFNSKYELICLPQGCQDLDDKPDLHKSECQPPKTQDAESISARELLYQMIDLDQLTRLPIVPFKTYLASSYNRLSDQAQIGDEDWFANQDYVIIEKQLKLVCHSRSFLL